VADFAPLGMMSTIPTVIVTNAQSRIATLQQLVEAAKAAPGKLNYSAGATSYQLMGELFNERSSVKTAFIPYKGSSEALNAILGQQVDFSVLDMSTALASIKGGKLRALAVAAEQRSPLLPDVPTAAEAGVAGYVASTWVAGVVSAKTPKPELDRLQKWFAQIAAQPETKAYHHGIGADVTAGGPAKLLEIQRQSIEVWKRVAANARIEQL
jgi:tripartite-type tricarboxylate transporter receptor subunit TctC